jgi:geranylgeranyl diphosphate synthase, type II
MEFNTYLKRKQKDIAASLEKYMAGKIDPPVLKQAMKYSVMLPGKRLRPFLVLEAAKMFKCPASLAMPTACAIEMVHVYSLIHDDLPAMDNSPLRRGKPTNHKVFGEAMAILAGDTLQAEAFNLISRCSNKKILGAELILKIIEELSEACSVEGMAAGQALDLISENKKISLTKLRRLHYLKTGRLIRAAVRMGAILGGASKPELNKLTAYAEHLGVAFQIRDDLLDVLGDTKKLGKKAGIDQDNQKSTYPQLLGIERSQKLFSAEMNAARKALQIFGEKAKILHKIIDYLDTN